MGHVSNFGKVRDERLISPRPPSVHRHYGACPVALYTACPALVKIEKTEWTCVVRRSFPFTDAAQFGITEQQSDNSGGGSEMEGRRKMMGPRLPSSTVHYYHGK